MTATGEITDVSIYQYPDRGDVTTTLEITDISNNILTEVT